MDNIKIIPYVTITLSCILILFEIYVNIVYKNRNEIKKKFCYLENNKLTIYNFYKIYTSLLTHTNFLLHFIPNLIITIIMGLFLENLIGTVRMFNYVMICIFIFWTFIYLLKIKPKTGCGFSAIFYSFFSIYFTIKAATEKNELHRLFYILLPIIILIIFHIFGKINSASTEFIHILSLMYGYIIGIYYNITKRFNFKNSNNSY